MGVAVQILIYFLLAAEVRAAGARVRPTFRCPEYIYVFGNSYTDTGNLQAKLAGTDLKYPYGESYRFPDRPNERTRYSNGRLILDFTTQAFNFPFSEPYSRNFDDKAYRRSVNFAFSTGTASNTWDKTLSLYQETDDYFKFRSTHTDSRYDPRSALYFIPEIGGNDFSYAYLTGLHPYEAVLSVVPKVLDAVKSNLERYYADGARNFAIFNIPPEGCSSFFLTVYGGEGPYDEYGCLIDYNNVLQAYNKELDATIQVYRETWTDANLFLFDFFDATFEVVQNAADYGFRTEHLTRACCGYGGIYNFNPIVTCGNTGYVPNPEGGEDIFVNISKACPDPDHYILWDGEHSTQAFYRVMAGFFLTGRFVDGPREYKNLKEQCNLDFSAWFDE